MRRNVAAFILRCAKEMAYQGQFVNGITPRRFHSHYMAHILRDAINRDKIPQFKAVNVCSN